MLGCGSIAAQYLASLERLPQLRLVAVCDPVREAAERAAAGRPEVRVASWQEILAAPDIDAVLNLTPPALHARATIEALDAGKHVYLEKPFATTLADADAMLAAASRAERRIGVAPDTMLGVGMQTARRLVDEGRIGTPFAATAFWGSPGHEAWHPNPGYYYLAGAGPLLDMGVYYLSALVGMLGPVTSVYGAGSRSRAERVVPDDAPRAGERLPVEVDTFVTATLTHADGAISTLTTSFDIAASTIPRIEVYGPDGTVSAGDPNRFDDEVLLAPTPRAPFAPVEPSAGFPDAGRGYGMADMADALAEGRPHRQSAEFGYHVNEVMLRILESIEDGRPVAVHSRCERPEPVRL